MDNGKAAPRILAGASAALLGRSRIFFPPASFRFGHLTEEALCQYGVNRLPDADVPSVLKHLLECESCFDRMLGMVTTAFVQMLRRTTGTFYGTCG
jgi:hypothetical protein